VLGTLEVGVHEGNEMWIGNNDATIVFSMSDGSGSYFLSVDGDRRPTQETSCTTPLAGRAAMWHLVTWAGQRDTTFMAMGGVVFDRASAMNIGVLAKVRTAREAMLQTVLSLERSASP
jgi:hypothetical protein